MKQLLRNFTAALLVSAVGLVSAPVSANGSPAVSGTFSPGTLAAGATATVTFEATGSTNVCDDTGPDGGGNSDGTFTYSNRPLVVGLFPTSVELNPESNHPEASVVDGTPLNELGFATAVGVLATSTYDPATTGNSGWQGSFTGQVTLPATLAPGTYNAVWDCGIAGTPEPEYDIGGTALVQQVTVTSAAPGPQPASDGISLTLDFSVGDNIRGGTLGVPVAGSGLQPGAEYTVVLRSDPVQIGAGVNEADGSFSAVYPMPADTPAGPHSVTVTSLNTAGQVVSAVAYFTLDANGTVTAISYEGPTPEAPAAEAPAAVARPSFTG